jgi:hypothetical protein
MNVEKFKGVVFGSRARAHFRPVAVRLPSMMDQSYQTTIEEEFLHQDEQLVRGEVFRNDSLRRGNSFHGFNQDLGVDDEDDENDEDDEEEDDDEGLLSGALLKMWRCSSDLLFLSPIFVKLM